MVLMLLILLNSAAQNSTPNLFLKRNIRQDNQSFQFFVMEDNADDKIAYSNDKEYYWFKSQTVVATQGAASGLILHGLFESFYDNKQLSSKGFFNKGLKNGAWTYWHSNGNIARTESWIKGYKRGKENHFDPLGNWLETIDYGSRTIELKYKDSIILTNNVGVKKKVVFLDSIGTVKQTIKYKNGRPIVKEKKKDADTIENKKKVKEIKKKEREKKDQKPKRKEKEEKTERKSDGNFWKRLFSKKKKDSHAQEPPKKFSWKCWKKENSTK